jgi:NitT/TauT family transport system substrate-binding protein
MSESLLHPIRLSPNGPIFDLPVYVAQEEGLFARHGLQVAFVERYAGNDIHASENPFERQKECLYENGRADAYNLCEWAGLDRSENSSRGSRVHALRPAVAAQAILSFDPEILEVRDLAGVPVGINERTGSHYTTLQILGGSLAREDVVLEHVGAPMERYEKLRAGRLRAAAVMEPFISLGLKEGAHIVSAVFYRGAEVISPQVPEPVRNAYRSALNEAAGLIRADFAKYKHYLTEQVGDRLRPEELFDHFVNYAQSRDFDEDRFAFTYQWMKSWDLTPGDKAYNQLAV